MWGIGEALFELAGILLVWFKAHNGHGQLRLDVVFVDNASGADLDRVHGPIVTI